MVRDGGCKSVVVLRNLGVRHASRLIKVGIIDCVVVAVFVVHDEFLGAGLLIMEDVVVGLGAGIVLIVGDAVELSVGNMNERTLLQGLQNLALVLNDTNIGSFGREILEDLVSLLSLVLGRFRNAMCEKVMMEIVVKVV